MKKDNNLVCPSCGKTITNKDLKHWKCSLCGADFKITLEPKNRAKKMKKEIKNKYFVRATIEFEIKCKDKEDAENFIGFTLQELEKAGKIESEMEGSWLSVVEVYVKKIG